MEHDSFASISAAERQQLRAYCLGTCSVAQADTLAERCFLEDDFFAAYEHEKERLIYDYLFKRCSAAERAQFEASFMAHPERRLEVQLLAHLTQTTIEEPQRVTVAAAIVPALSATAQQAAKPKSFWLGLIQLRPLSFALLALLCLSGLAWWLLSASSDSANAQAVVVVEQPLAPAIAATRSGGSSTDSTDKNMDVQPFAGATSNTPMAIALRRQTRTVTVRLLVDATDLTVPYQGTIQFEGQATTASIIGADLLAETLPSGQVVVPVRLTAATFIKTPGTYRLTLTRGTSTRTYRMHFSCADCWW